MLNQLLETIIQILTGWVDKFTSHAQHVEDKLDSLDQTASDIKTNTEPISDIKDNTGAVVTPVQNIKSNTDSIKQSSQTSANNTTAILNNISTLSTNTGRAAAYAEDCANNTLEIKDKVTTIASDTTQIRADHAELENDLDKIYNAIKWSCLDIETMETESGASPLTFNTDKAAALVSLISKINYSQSGSDTPALDNIRTITGLSSGNITVNGTIVAISFGTTVVGGYVDIISGKLIITHALIELAVADMNNSETYPGWRNSGIRNVIGAGLDGNTQGVLNVGSTYSYNTKSANDILYLSRADYNLTQTQWTTNYPDLTVQVIVPYTTPVEVTLTASVINSIVGDNIISTDTNGNIEVTYKESVKHYLDKQDN